MTQILPFLEEHDGNANGGLKHLWQGICKSPGGSEVGVRGLKEVGEDGAAPHGYKSKKQTPDGVEGGEKERT